MQFNSGRRGTTWEASLGWWGDSRWRPKASLKGEIQMILVIGYIEQKELIELLTCSVHYIFLSLHVLFIVCSYPYNFLLSHVPRSLYMFLSLYFLTLHVLLGWKEATESDEQFLREGSEEERKEDSVVLQSFSNVYQFFTNVY